MHISVHRVEFWAEIIQVYNHVIACSSWRVIIDLFTEVELGITANKLEGTVKKLSNIAMATLASVKLNKPKLNVN